MSLYNFPIFASLRISERRKNRKIVKGHGLQTVINMYNYFKKKFRDKIDNYIVNETNYFHLLYEYRGRAMAQAVNRWPLTAEARVRAPVDPCGICSGQSGTGADFSPRYSVFSCQYHSTIAPYSCITAL
jgi:hypothetical protein